MGSIWAQGTSPKNKHNANTAFLPSVSSLQLPAFDLIKNSLRPPNYSSLQFIVSEVGFQALYFNQRWQVTRYSKQFQATFEQSK